MTHLPIDDILPALRETLARRVSAVLAAPPGAGKTTRVPTALLGERWLGNNRIVMLEPRRLAARAAARRMSQELGRPVGDLVGYRTRLDTRVGPNTRVEVVTEGVLTRMLQSDPALEGVGLLIFDEFHERNVQGDLGLALALQARELLRGDLRILVMSATLDVDAVVHLLGDAPVLRSEGKTFTVETRYLERSRDDEPIERTAAAAVRDTLGEQEGDILLFLPGTAEIRRTVALLENSRLPPGTRIAPLYGNLSPEEQDRAIAPARPGERKVVAATSIAETSLTIEGIRTVIDSGLMRVPRFSPRTGMTRLVTVRVSAAGADQRRGRAGRLGPGVCYRLWTRTVQDELAPFSRPEILEADPAPIALDLAEWGIADPTELAWLDPPPPAPFAQARELLRELGALDEHGAITSHGREMAALPLHPRPAHMLLRSVRLGLAPVGCALAALLGDRDIFRPKGGRFPDPDLRLRLSAIRNANQGGRSEGMEADMVDRGALRRAIMEAERLAKRLRIAYRPPTDQEMEACGILLALAYPDRIGRLRSGSRDRYLLRNGLSALLPDPGHLTGSPFLVAAELDGKKRESRIFLAAPVGLEELEKEFADQVEHEESIAWESAGNAVTASVRDRLGALVLREKPLRNPDPTAVAEALLSAVEEKGPEALPWDREARRLRERLIFLGRHLPNIPDVSDTALFATLRPHLLPRLHGMRRPDDLRKLDLTAILRGLPDWQTQRAMDEWAPTHITVPSGSRIPIDYSDPDAPVLAVRLQEMFGCTETPRVAAGTVPLTIHLLSPAHRPVQVTRDLANFWRTTYFDVRKDMKGRYPKHHWPDDPLAAPPTNRTKRRK